MVMQTQRAQHFYEFVPFRFDPEEKVLQREDEIIPLPPKPTEILLLLIQNRGRIVEKEKFLKEVWPNTFVEESSLTVNISFLRKILGEGQNGKKFIETVPRRGYRFVATAVERFVEASTPLVAASETSVFPSEGPEVPSRESSTPQDTPLDPARPEDALYEWRSNVPSIGLFGRLGLCLAGGVIVSAAVWFMFFRANPNPLPPVRIVPFTTHPGFESSPSFSPDGNQIAFAWDSDKGGHTSIYVNLIGAGEPLRLTGDDSDDSFPAWSPDGRYIAFVRYFGSSSPKGIFLVSSLGGPERKVAEIIPGRWPHLAWTSDGSHLAVRDAESVQRPLSIFLVSVETGEKRKLTSPADATVGDSRPAFSPDGKSLAFVRTTGANREDIFIMPANGGIPRQLTFDGSQVLGLAWTADARELVFSSARSGSIVLWRIPDQGGSPERLAAVEPNALYPSISRKGDRLAYTTAFEDSNIWRVQFSQGKIVSPPNLLISSTRADFDPQYSPDGKKIAFISTRTGKSQIWLCDDDGANTFQLTSLDGAIQSLAWSPDGKRIAFDLRADENSDIYETSLEQRRPRRLTSESSEDSAPSWSKDGRWLYFASNRAGKTQVWKIPTEGGGQVIQVTKAGGFDAKESPDGKYLYYAKAGDATGIWRLPVQGGEETLAVDLFEAGYLRCWAPTNEGIYFATKRTTPKHTIQFFNFATRRLTQISQLDKPPLVGLPGLGLSPDEHSILYTLLDQSGSDIMLVENFR
jgi:Tol biopolymer transport system component/DNA-binding winged helix-turn-helix (wHTH) protein